MQQPIDAGRRLSERRVEMEKLQWPPRRSWAKKVGMTQIWDDQNRAIPVTVVRVAPVRVVQVKTPEREGYSALQVTWGHRRDTTLTKPERGHFDKAGVDPGRKLVELRLDDASEFEVGSS